MKREPVLGCSNIVVGKTGVLAGFPVCLDKQHSKSHQHNVNIHELEIKIEEVAKKSYNHNVIFY